MSNLHELLPRIAALDARLRPIAKRPIDINQPDWEQRLAERPHPLDEAGVRQEAASVLDELCADYAAGSAGEREAIRRLFDRHDSFAWAASLPYPPDTEDRLRKHLLLFAMSDQGRDTRDAILLLEDLCETAKKAQVATALVLREIAKLASDRDKYGMGSTRDLLLRRARRSST